MVCIAVNLKNLVVVQEGDHWLTPHPQTACCMGMGLCLSIQSYDQYVRTSLALVLPNFSNEGLRTILV